MSVRSTDREAFFRVSVDHASEQLLTVVRHEGGNLEPARLHLLQQLPQIVIIERKRALKYNSPVTRKFISTRGVPASSPVRYLAG